MRLGFIVSAVLALALVTTPCDAASRPVPPDDELLATASYVFDAVAEKQLAERDWLFKGTSITNSALTAGRSPYFVGWWNIKPEGAERWAVMFPLHPAPQNSKTLAEGKRFLVVADEDFHLLLVHPVGPKPDQYLPGMTERGFRDHVVYLRGLYSTVHDFLAAVTDGDWRMAEWALCDSLRKGMRASRDPDAYLAKLGLCHLPSAIPPAFDILSMAEKKARVLVEGNDRSGVEMKVALTLTRTRRSMGPPEWEIVQISKVKERP